MTKLFFALAVCALLAGAGHAASGIAATAPGGELPARFCSRVVTDDVVRPIPGSLVPAAQHAFGLAAMPPAVIQASTFFRCSDRRVLLCTVGANLPCGKADTSTSLPEAGEWCVKHPGAASIPASVVGHATIYDWKCDDVKAVTAGAILHVDPRGFVAEYWKPAK